MRVPPSASAGVAVLALAGCNGDAEPSATVSRVAPAAAYNDTPVPVSIQGGPFRPAYSIDLGGGSSSIEKSAFDAFLVPWAQGQDLAPLGNLVWHSDTELGAEIPQGLPAGLYDVQLQDPRGHTTTLSGAFQSLGPDRDAPVVTIVAPAMNTVVAAETDVAVMLRADDGTGGHLAQLDWTLTWLGGGPTSGSCVVPPDASQAPCTFSFTAPTLSLFVDSLTITAVAADRQGNAAMASTQIWVAFPPSVTTFSPSAGPTTGMIDLQVKGENFISEAGGTQILIDGVPVADVVFTGSIEMHGLVPPHDPGVVPLVVKTGAASVMAGFFDYVARPDVRAVDPPDGPSTGGIPVKIAGDHFRPGATRILFGTPPGAAELVCPTFVSDHLITGFTPPGTGTVSVVATDPIGGEGDQPQAFTYTGSGGTGGTGGAGDAGDAGGDAGGNPDGGGDEVVVAPFACPPPDDGGTP